MWNLNNPISYQDPSGFDPSDPVALSQEGLRFIANHEGRSLKVYNDSAGNPTIGYGHLVGKGEDYSKGITDADALKLLSADAKTAVDAVNNLTSGKLPQHQFDALVDFTFNLGSGSLASSTLLKNINSGTEVIKSNFTDWDLAGGVKSQGLLNRRTDEYSVYTTPIRGPLP